MAKYLLIMSSSISSLSETVANVESVITVSASSNIVTDDEILVYVDDPINQIRMSFKATEDQNGTRVKAVKQFETSHGMTFEDLSDTIKTNITDAISRGDALVALTDSEFENIDFEIRSLITPERANDAEHLYMGFTNPELEYPYNYIFYGAPGTGKSNTCERLRKANFPEENYERVTFYDRYSYANFVGAYKPITEDGEVIYAFTPGPFIRLLLEALLHKDKNYVLIIEEINRAKAASVFGDVFQLLDRSGGISEYPIMTSEDMRRYLAKAYYGETFDENNMSQIETFKYLRIPKNLYIWATMNSMDQGVTSLDTAFKRRWEFKYIGVNDPETLTALKAGNYKIPMILDSSKRYFVDWNDLREKINKKLLDMPGRIPEDKLMGPFFISADLLKKVNSNPGDDAAMISFIHTFESKVLMYLFDDAAKSKPDEIFQNYEGDLVLSELFKEFEKSGETIFDIKIAQYDFDVATSAFIERT